MPSRKELANAIRALSMDAVQQANSGHPGAPMGMADIAEVLWNDHLNHNPADPTWSNRDRFVMSNGHGSMLVYSLLHLTGYPLSMDELKNFRQLGSKTPGHPEYDPEIGVETTTGPLGQGISNAVGLALAEKTLAAQFNRPGFDVVDHYTYCFTGDGCLMEGISHEACSLAGTLGLGKLICFYDDNNISIDGDVSGWFTDDTAARFQAYGWQVIPKVDGHDAAAVDAAIKMALSDSEKPTLICCQTVIGWGSPNKAGTAATHGAPLGPEEVQGTREQIGWTHPPFEVPAEISDAWSAKKKGKETQTHWEELFSGYEREHPELAAEYLRRTRGRLPDCWGQVADDAVTKAQADAESVASRKASLIALNGLAPVLPELIGGSADLTGSNLTFWSGSKALTRDDASGNYIYFGVREFGMSAIANGMALHGGFIPYTATFLTFSDYARNAIRMAALMEQQQIFVYTHDSIGLGEDGPTHQPVEHVQSLRLIPNVSVWRPCDVVETLVAWRSGIENVDGPTCLVLSRQGLPHQERATKVVDQISRGGYVLSDSGSDPKAIIMATGSEVGLAMSAQDQLAAQGIQTRVVSIPNMGVFAAQDAAYRNDVLPVEMAARVAVEAGSTDGWYRWVGPQGRVIGIDRFGESAPAKEVYKHLGVTAEAVVEAVKEQI